MKTATIKEYLTRGDTLYFPYAVSVDWDEPGVFEPVDLTEAESITAQVRTGRNRGFGLIADLTLANDGIKINPEDNNPPDNDVFALRVEKSVMDTVRGGVIYADVVITFPSTYPESDRVTVFEIVTDIREGTQNGN